MLPIGAKAVKWIAGSLVGILVTAVAFYAVKYAVKEYREYRIVSQLDTTLTGLRERAKEDYPEDPLSVATQKMAQEKAAEILEGATTVRQKRISAATQFFGFYNINVQTRREFCANLGVNIDRYMGEFTRAHAEELARASEIYRNAGIDVERVWDMAKDSTRQFLVQDMQDASVASQLTLAETCQLFNEVAVELVAETHLSEASPLVYKALMEIP